MTQFSMNCTCGDVMSVEAESREEAVSKLQGIMNAEGIAEHMAAKHPGDMVPPVSAIHADIEQKLQAVS